MSNSQHFFLSPQESEQSTDYGPYNLNQIHAARKSLFERVCYGQLRWLSTTMRLNSSHYVGRAMTSNLWEGDWGMMEHVNTSFPMPPCSSFSAEKSFSEPYLPSWSSSDIYQHQSYEEFPVEYSEMTSSLDFEESFGDANNFGVMRTDSMFDSSAESCETGGRVGFNAEKYNLIRKLTNMSGRINGSHKKLSDVEAKLSVGCPRQQKHQCMRLCRLHKETLKYRKGLNIFKKKVERCGYMKLNTLAYGVTRRLKKLHKHQDELSLALSNAVTNFENLRCGMKNVFRDHTKLIEPHRVTLNNAITDLLGDSPKDEPLLRRLTENEGTQQLENEGTQQLENEGTQQLENEGTQQLENDLRTSLPGDNKKCNGNFDGAFNSAERHLPGKNEIGQPSVEAHGSDKDLSCGKIDYLNMSTEDVFWNSLSKLREEMCTTLVAVNEIIKNPFNPLGKKRKLLNSKCEQLVSLHKEIISLKEMFSKLKGEMDRNNYTERGPFGLDDLKRRGLLSFQSNWCSLDVVEALLNFLVSSYMRVREKLSPALQKYEFIADSGDLAFKVAAESTSLIRICAHMETCVDSAVITESHSSIDPQTTKSFSQGTPHYPLGSSREINPRIPQKEQMPGNGDDFLNCEVQHWNRLQKLNRSLKKFGKSIRNKSRTSWMEEDQIETILKSVHNEIKHLTELFAAEESESNSAGYCKEVGYTNIEFLSPTTVRFLVKSLAGVQARVSALNEQFVEIANKFGMSHLCDS